jgi:hypothetical protein
MQQKRNKIPGAGNDKGSGPWASDRRSAVAVLEMEIARRNARGSENAVSLPLDIARLVLECAKAGMHKGQGRRRPHDGYAVKQQKKAIAAYAKQRKAELFATLKYSTKTGANSAEDQALKEAVDFARERYGILLGTNTIKRLMQRSDF